MFSYKYTSIIQEPPSSVNYFRQFIGRSIAFFAFLTPTNAFLSRTQTQKKLAKSQIAAIIAGDKFFLEIFYV